MLCYFCACLVLLCSLTGDDLSPLVLLFAVGVDGHCSQALGVFVVGVEGHCSQPLGVYFVLVLKMTVASLWVCLLLVLKGL